MAENSTSPPDLSIVMCTYDRIAMMRDALESLVRQQTEDRFSFEVVVVHAGKEGSRETIEEIARRAAVPVRAIHVKTPGQVAARNAGLAAARGAWIANWDDDQIADSRWLVELWNLAHEKNSPSVGGSLELKLQGECPLHLTPLMRRMLGATVPWDSPQPYTRQEGPGSGNQLLRRDVFERVGMWSESFTLRGYDTDLYRRIRAAGIESWFTPTAKGWHVIPAERLTEEFFRETALHNGWSFARRDMLERGRAVVMVFAVARLIKAALNCGRGTVRSWFGSKKPTTLDGRIYCWRAQGYLRSVLYWTSPRLFPQRGFFARYEFRPEEKFRARLEEPRRGGGGEAAVGGSAPAGAMPEDGSAEQTQKRSAQYQP